MLTELVVLLTELQIPPNHETQGLKALLTQLLI